MAELRAQSATSSNHGVQSLRNIIDLQQSLSGANIREVNADSIHKVDIKSENANNFMSNSGDGHNTGNFN